MCGMLCPAGEGLWPLARFCFCLFLSLPPQIRKGIAQVVEHVHLIWFTERDFSLMSESHSWSNR
jgi:hypothetical protein